MALKKHPAPAKILNRGTQNTSIKVVKKQKTVVKTTLENPFALDWPLISEELEKEISLQLESCCRDLKIPVCKPPWREVHKLRGKERITYCQEYKKTFFEKLLADPDSASKYELAKEARSHLIFGYNAVMRSLEQNRLAGILVMKDAEPTFLVQTFLPGCVNKRVPLVPIFGLDNILKSEETLAVQHSVMVLGLKPSVKESSCRFYPLYAKMIKVTEGLDKVHEALEIKHKTENSEILVTSNIENSEQSIGSTEILLKKKEVEENTKSTESLVENKENSKQNVESSEILVNIKKENNHKEQEMNVAKYKKKENNHKEQEMNVAKYKLNQEQIQSYHLKRTNKCERAFIPRSKKAKTVKDSGEDVIFVEPITKDETLFFKEKQKSDYKSSTFKKEEKASVTEPKDFCFEFFIDTTGTEDKEVKIENAGGSNEEIGVEKKNQNLDGKDGKDEKKKKNPNGIGRGGSEEKKRKKNPRIQGDNEEEKEKKNPKMMQKAKLSVTYPYVSAKTKRIKNNPNRRGNIRKQ